MRRASDRMTRGELTYGGTSLRLADAGVIAPIARPRETDRDLINPSATWTPSTATADLTERGRADGTIASAIATHAAQGNLDTSDAAACAPSGGSHGRATVDPAGRRGIGSRGRPSFRAARAGEDATSVAAQTVGIHGHRGVAVMSPRPFLPRAVPVWPLPSRVAVAPGSRTRPPDRPASCGSLAPLVDVRSRTSGRVSRSGGAPSGEAQESIERCGSATNRPRYVFPRGRWPRSRPGAAGERQGGKATR